jgi:5'-methylthioadenosine phosphorylase
LKNKGKGMGKLGIIGGSGLYSLEFQNAEWLEVDTYWGKPSDKILRGELDGVEVHFLPRHGRGHIYSPTTVPYKANIAALKKCGVEQIISFSACGSLNEQMAPGDFVVVSQYIDRTVQRDKSFFGTSCVAHVSLADPTCCDQNSVIISAAKKTDITVFPSGTYLAMEGPQFSTRAESLLYKDNWGCDVIGMTNVPEMNLAREAQICYSSVAMVTDFDCWHEGHDAVTLADIIKVMQQNVENSQKLLKEIIAKIQSMDYKCQQHCNHSLENAIITSRDKLNKDILDELNINDG